MHDKIVTAQRVWRRKIATLHVIDHKRFAVTRAQLCPDDSLVCQLSATKGAPAEKPFAVLEITALQCATTARQPEDYGEKTRKYNK